MQEPGTGKKWYEVLRKEIDWVVKRGIVALRKWFEVQLKEKTTKME